jgi:hypothetical protein
MDGRRFVVLVGAAALVAPLTGWTAMPANATGPVPAAVPASQCFTTTDNGDPVLKTFGFSPVAIDSRAGSKDVTFTATAEDTGGPGAPSGVAGATVYVSFDDSGNWNLRAPMKPDGNGGLVGTLTILKQYRTATRYVSLSVDDVAGNSTMYSTADLEQMGLPTTFTTVTTPDAGKPAVRTVRLSTRTVDTRAHSKTLGIKVRATDDSAVKAIRVWLWGSPIRSSTAHLRLVAGTVADGTWQGQIRVPRWQGNSTAKLAIELVDMVDGYRMYGPRKLAAIGQPGTVRVLSRTDTEEPRLRLPSVTPTSVDLHSGVQSVTVAVRATDRLSGVRSVSLTLRGPADGDDGGQPSMDVRLVRVSGTAQDGIWKATVALRPCDVVAGNWAGAAFATDATTGSYVEITRAFTVLNGDILRPRAQLVGDYYQVRRGGPLTVTFNEDVVGVTADNALVHVGDNQRGQAGDNPPAIAGTWACKDASGSVVDCAAGPVRRAAFTPTSPMIPRTNHTLVLNPEHHLGLTDLAGNPYDPTYGVNFHTS